MRLSTAAYIAISLHFLRGISRKVLAPCRKPRSAPFTYGSALFVSMPDPGYPNIIVARISKFDFSIAVGLAHLIEKELDRRGIPLHCYMLTEHDTASQLGDGSYSIPYPDCRIRSAVLAAASGVKLPDARASSSSSIIIL